MPVTSDPETDREHIGKWADLVYLPRGEVTHIKAHTADNGSIAYPAALCGRSPRYFDVWRGTGNQTEHDKARRLPLCAPCLKLARTRNA